MTEVIVKQTRKAAYPSLQGRRVFVTGGASGIGACIVRAFAEQGARVAFVDIAGEAGAALCEAVEQEGFARPLFTRCDITDVGALQAAIAGSARELGGSFDILVNNAANDQRHRIEDVSVSYYDDRIAINQRPLFFAVQSVAPGMIAQGGGSIINISSISWHAKGAGYPVYAAAKAAAHGLTRGLARDLGRHNVRVNTVTPGWVMTQRQMEMWVDAAALEEIGRNQCLPGQLLPEHIASMCLYLGADDSAMCSAQEFVVDAGWT
ncbi:SDR family oxidoreductase [Massilia terrae]|uniref:SDR family oxidoreductase n=1 Tax=Massilia terrae TaxID=1811224 RepID=A0ABT2CT99_9BURK|nr:SDR family oxidoreductase [Massilia terrae]MCS0657174.1 SDR family oxidoreductase [Massilia terrae]